MTTHHELLQELFFEASGLDDVARTAFLERSCPDPNLRAEVEELLRADEDSQDFLDGSALASSQAWLVGGADETEEPPLAIGPYEVLGTVGEGGMGIVYLARQDHPNREVAVKVLRPGRMSVERMQRLEAEADLLGRLAHPGIAQVFEGGTFEQGGVRRPYFVMELVRGRGLLEHVREQGLDLEQRLALLIEIGEAIQHAHQRGVVHRDLKPGNILVTEAGHPKVLDFGVSATIDGPSGERPSSGELAGTLPYMAPEQVRSDAGSVDPRVDVYALGVLLYQLITGELPIPVAGRSAAQMLLAVAQEAPRPLTEAAPKAPLDLEYITTRALAKVADERYPSPAALVEDLRRFLAKEPIRARPHSAGYVLRCYVARNLRLVAATTVMSLALIGAGVAVVVKSLDAEEKSREVARVDRLAAEESERANRISQFLTANLLAQLDPMRASLANFDVEAMIESVLAGAIEELEEASPGDLARVLHELAGNYMDRWKLADAELIHRRALELGRQEFGPDDDFCLEVGNDLALTLRDLDRRPEAVDLLEELLTLGRSAYNEDHPTLLSLAHNRALLHDDAGEFDRAHELFVHVLGLREETLGVDHPATLASRAGLTEVLVVTGKTQEARLNLELVLASQRRTLDQPRLATGLGIDPETMTTMEQLADIYRELGELAESRDLLVEAYAARLALHGQDHDHTLASQYKLAKTWTELGEPAVAEELLRKAIDASVRVNGDDHLSTGFLRNELARALRAQARHGEALAEARRSLAIRERRYPPGHVNLGFGQAELARIFHDAEQFGEADAAYLVALATLGTNLEDDNWKLNVVRADRARTLFALERLSEAREQMEAALVPIETELGMDNPRVLGLYAALLEIVEAQGDAARAAGLRRRLGR